jgi:hypothetical protein
MRTRPRLYRTLAGAVVFIIPNRKGTVGFRRRGRLGASSQERANQYRAYRAPNGCEGTRQKSNFCRSADAVPEAWVKICVGSRHRSHFPLHLQPDLDNALSLVCFLYSRCNRA